MTITHDGFVLPPSLLCTCNLQSFPPIHLKRGYVAGESAALKVLGGPASPPAAGTKLSAADTAAVSSRVDLTVRTIPLSLPALVTKPSCTNQPQTNHSGIRPHRPGYIMGALNIFYSIGESVAPFTADALSGAGTSGACSYPSHQHTAPPIVMCFFIAGPCDADPHHVPADRRARAGTATSTSGLTVSRRSSPLYSTHMLRDVINAVPG